MAALLGAHIIKVKPPTDVPRARGGEEGLREAEDRHLDAGRAHRARRAVLLQRQAHRRLLGRRGEGPRRRLQRGRAPSATAAATARSSAATPSSARARRRSKMLDTHHPASIRARRDRRGRAAPALSDHAAGASIRRPSPTALAAALDAGDVACVQLRLKDVDDDAIRRAADVLRPIAQSRDVAFIMNDRPDLAAADRLRRRACRPGGRALRRGAAHPRARRASSASPATTAAISPSRPPRPAPTMSRSARFFPIDHQGPRGIAGADPEILALVERDHDGAVRAPSAASRRRIAAPLVEAGADFLAVIAAVWDHPKVPPRRGQSLQRGDRSRRA